MTDLFLPFRIDILAIPSSKALWIFFINFVDGILYYSFPSYLTYPIVGSNRFQAQFHYVSNRL